MTATYLINILPTTALHVNKTPYELWHHKKPRLDNLKIFGSTVYVHVKNRKTKFEEKSMKGILMGYVPNGYKIWDVEKENFIIARDVIIDEINYKVTSLIKSDSDSISPPKTNKTDLNSEKLVNTEHKNIQLDHKTSNETETSNLRRSERIKNHPLPLYTDDNDQDINNDIYNSHILCAQILVNSIPKFYHEIKTRDDCCQWEAAIKEEIDSLNLNNTWTVVNRPIGKNIVDCKWVFSVKIDEQGNPTKYKARLVAKGFSQKYLIDYNETFAPVARITTFRVMLAFSNQHDLLVHHMDMKTAFLHGNLDEEIYMKIPEGLKANVNKVC